MPGQTRCQNRRSRALGVLLPKPHWEKKKQKNTTKQNKTIWLILSVCLPDHHGARQPALFFFFFFFSFQLNLFLTLAWNCEHLWTLSCRTRYFDRVTSTLCASRLDTQSEQISGFSAEVLRRPQIPSCFQAPRYLWTPYFFFSSI